MIDVTDASKVRLRVHQGLVTYLTGPRILIKIGLFFDQFGKGDSFSQVVNHLNPTWIDRLEFLNQHGPNI